MGGAKFSVLRHSEADSGFDARLPIYPGVSAVEDGLNVLMRMGQILHQQVAVYPVERLGQGSHPNTLTTVYFTGGSLSRP
jgi:hypothetical protein